jgi:hypothetical protein
MKYFGQILEDRTLRIELFSAEQHFSLDLGLPLRA